MKNVILTSIFLIFSCSEDNNNDYKKYVFLTQDGYEGFSLGGLSGADEICSKEALDSGLISQSEYENRQFIAWISTEQTNAKDRLPSVKMDGHPIEYYMVNDGFVGSYTDIINSTLINSINIDSYGFKEEQPYSYVWTGTKYNGTLFDDNFIGDCGGWKEFKEDSYGIAGRSDKKNINWTNDQEFESFSCINFFKLYCFEK